MWGQRPGQVHDRGAGGKTDGNGTGTMEWGSRGARGGIAPVQLGALPQRAQCAAHNARECSYSPAGIRTRKARPFLCEHHARGGERTLASLISIRVRARGTKGEGQFINGWYASTTVAPAFAKSRCSWAVRGVDSSWASSVPEHGHLRAPLRRWAWGDEVLMRWMGPLE